MNWFLRAAQPMMRISSVCLAVVSLAILFFGVVAVVVPSGEYAALYRADGLASIGFGFFGALIVLVPFRRTERWAWYALWFYPVFWLVHLLGNLPPGTDHFHQIIFIVLSLTGLLLPVRTFFPAQRQDVPGSR